MQDDESSLLDFQRQQLLFRPGRIIETFKACAAAVGGQEARFQSEFVSARNRPQAAVGSRSVLEREPQANHSERLSVKERSVLMTRNLPANARLLEDVHRLEQQRIIN